ncbi:MAG: hypothetical protein AAGA58_10255 [Verrucomicrobiota bacterium]
MEYLNSVVDEPTLIEFLNALAKDKADETRKEKANPSSPYGPGANGWDSQTIEDYLFSAAAWAEASKGDLPAYKRPENPWKRFADILYTGKIYE